MRNRLVLDSLPSLRPQSLCPQAKGEVGDTERILMLVFRDTGALVETNWSDAANQADKPPKREGANHVIAIGSPDTERPYYLSLLLSKIIMTISRKRRRGDGTDGRRLFHRSFLHSALAR